MEMHTNFLFSSVSYFLCLLGCCFLMLVRCRGLYEQDEAISECLLPHLLNLVKHYPESSTLAKNLEHWARNSAAIVKENLSICMQLQLGIYKICQIAIMIVFIIALIITN